MSPQVVVAQLTEESASVDDMAPEADTNGDKAAIVITRRNLGWLMAGLLTLMSGGQLASFKLTGPDEDINRAIAALNDRVDHLAEQNAAKEAHFDRILNAILIYEIESARYARETRGPNAPARSPELEAAEDRLRALAVPR